MGFWRYGLARLEAVSSVSARFELIVRVCAYFSSLGIMGHTGPFQMILSKIKAWPTQGFGACAPSVSCGPRWCWMAHSVPRRRWRRVARCSPLRRAVRADKDKARLTTKGSQAFHARRLLCSRMAPASTRAQGTLTLFGLARPRPPAPFHPRAGGSAKGSQARPMPKGGSGTGWRSYVFPGVSRAFPAVPRGGG